MASSDPLVDSVPDGAYMGHALPGCPPAQTMDRAREAELPYCPVAAGNDTVDVSTMFPAGHRCDLFNNAGSSLVQKVTGELGAVITSGWNPGQKRR